MAQSTGKNLFGFRQQIHYFQCARLQVLAFLVIRVFVYVTVPRKIRKTQGEKHFHLMKERFEIQMVFFYRKYEDEWKF